MSDLRDELKFLLKHSSIYGIGNLVSRAVAFVLLPLYTRYLTPTDYGTLELVDVTTGMVGIVIGLGISTAVSRFYYESTRDQDRHLVLSTAYIVATVFTLMGALVAAALSPTLAAILLDSPAKSHVFLVAFAGLAVGALVDLGQVTLRLQYKSIAFNVISIVNLALGVMLNVWFIVFLHWGVLGVLMSSLLTRLAIGVPLSAWALSRTGLRFDRGLAMQMLRFGAPMIPSTLAMAFVSYSDRYFLKRFANIADVGIWGLANKVGTAIHMLITSPFIMTFLPRRFEIAKRPDAPAIFSRVAEYFLLGLVGLGLIVAMFAREIMVLMTTPAFYRAGAFVPWVVLGMVLFGMKYHFEFGILYAKKTHHYAVVNVATGVIHVGLNLVLVRTHGIWGAAFASVVAYAVNTVAICIAGLRLYPIPFAFGRMFRVAGIAILLVVAAQWIHAPSVFITVALKVGLLLAYPVLLLLTGSIDSEGRATVLALVKRRIGTGGV